VKNSTSGNTDLNCTAYSLRKREKAIRGPSITKKRVLKCAHFEAQTMLAVCITNATIAMYQKRE